MSDTLEVITPAPSQPVAEHRNAAPSRLWQRLGLGGVLLISLFMNFYQLGQNGFGNLYYAAAIRSMLDSWHTPSRFVPYLRLDSYRIAIGWWQASGHECM